MSKPKLPIIAVDIFIRLNVYGLILLSKIAEDTYLRFQKIVV